MSICWNFTNERCPKCNASLITDGVRVRCFHGGVINGCESFCDYRGEDKKHQTTMEWPSETNQQEVAEGN